MRKRLCVSTLLLFSLWLKLAAQQQPQPQPSPSPQPAQTTATPQAGDQDSDVVRITTNLVQVDAVVTKNGKHINDLRPEDFELFEDGHPQKITNFSYLSNISTAAPESNAATPATKADTSRVPIVPAAPHPNDMRRTMALLIDDLGMSFEGIASTRNQVRKFLQELQPNDLVAIIRTGSDVGALQQFTTDRRLLTSALDTLDLPATQYGMFQFRVAVRDTISSRIGAAGQFVEVPNLKNERLALSGIVVSGGSRVNLKTGEQNLAPTPSPSPQINGPRVNTTQVPNQQARSGGEINSGPAVRRFHQGANLFFVYAVYNARRDETSHLPQLTTQTLVFRDGKAIFTGSPTALDPTGQRDPERITAGAELQLGSGLTPGQYVLQIIVEDHRAKDKRGMATQWIDFEVVK
jgi:VWFA-related protein